MPTDARKLGAAVGEQQKVLEVTQCPLYGSFSYVFTWPCGWPSASTAQQFPTRLPKAGKAPSFRIVSHRQ